jgi:hypothetical protein
LSKGCCQKAVAEKTVAKRLLPKKRLPKTVVKTNTHLNKAPSQDFQGIFSIVACRQVYRLNDQVSAAELIKAFRALSGVKTTQHLDRQLDQLTYQLSTSETFMPTNTLNNNF